MLSLSNVGILPLLALGVLSANHCHSDGITESDDEDAASTDGSTISPDGSTTQVGDGGGVVGDGSSASDSSEPAINIVQDASRPPSGSCALQTPAFCETFDAPLAPGGRATGIDGKRIGIARHGGDWNVPQNTLNWFKPASAAGCNGPITVLPPDDYFFCDGGPNGTGGMHLRQAYDDAGRFTVHSMSIRQPFDFAGRTGKVVFDMDGWFTPGHGAWIEFWISDQPIPVPYHESPEQAAYPRNAVGVEFRNGACSTTKAVSNAPSAGHVFRDYAIARTYTDRDFTGGKCFATARQQFNHFEVEISTDAIEFFVSDVGKTNRTSAGRLSGLNLNFSRGYVHLQHSHYNGNKPDNGEAQPDNSSETHIYDNFGFDGPVVLTPRVYEVPNSLTKKDNGVNTGYSLANRSQTFTLPGVDLTDAQSASINLTLATYVNGMMIEYKLNNGPWRQGINPFKESQAEPRSLSVPIVLGDLVAGSNQLEIRVAQSNGFTQADNISLQVVPSK